MIVPAEQAVEERAHGLEAGGRIGNKEDQNDQRGDEGEDVLLVVIALRKEFRDRSRPDFVGVDTETFRDEQEVQIGADGETDDGPADLRHAAQVGEAGEAHQQIGTHIRRFRAHRGDQGIQTAAAEIELGCAGAGSSAAVHDPDDDGYQQIDDDRRQDPDAVAAHTVIPLFRL